MDFETLNTTKNDLTELVIRFNQALNDGDVDTMMRLMTSDCVFENTYPPPDGERYIGQEAVRAFWEEFFRGSSQVRLEIEDLFTSGERCAMRWTYYWVDAAGQAGHIRGVDLYHFKDDLIAEKLSYVKG